MPTGLIFTFQSLPVAGNYADTAINIKMSQWAANIANTRPIPTGSRS